MSSDSSIFKRTATAGAVMLALLSFAAAAALSNAPALPEGAAPDAADVRRGRNTAIVLAHAIAADGTSRPLRLSGDDLGAAATLANHGLDWLRVRPVIRGDALTVEASLQLADATWLNVTSRILPSDGFPHIEVDIGAWSLPSGAVRLVMFAADAWVRWRGYDLPALDTMVRDFAVSGDAAAATIAVPERLLKVASQLLGDEREAVDPALVRHVYGRLIAAEAADRASSMATQVRRAFDTPPEGADPVEYNRAAFVALAMFGVDSNVRRLAGRVEVPGWPQGLKRPELALAGRADLAKHFLLSAALAATLDQRFTRAMGEWKELDDSLPGGSGFSFVDLAADRAGLHLARAATDPATAGQVAAQLAQATDAMLFPPAAGGLAEGLGDAEFRRSYGGLDTMSYAEAVRRVDRLLDSLPLYAPLIRSS